MINTGNAIGSVAVSQLQCLILSSGVCGVSHVRPVSCVGFLKVLQCSHSVFQGQALDPSPPWPG